MPDESTIMVTTDCVRLVIDGSKVFDGTKAELKMVLEQHKRFMDYLDSHADGGEL